MFKLYVNYSLYYSCFFFHFMVCFSGQIQFKIRNLNVNEKSLLSESLCRLLSCHFNADSKIVNIR
jgi:hypothetical protein